MSQYWGPPSYPPPRPPQYQPPAPLEPDYYYDTNKGSTAQSLIYFLAGSCLTLVLVSCCLTALISAWAADSYFGLTDTLMNQSLATGTATPETSTANSNTDLNTSPPLTQSLSIFPLGQPVVANDVAVELIALDIQRNVVIQNQNEVPLEAGKEFVAVSVQLRSLSATEPAQTYTPQNFQIQNAQTSTLYAAQPQADNGRLLRLGSLPPPQPADNNQPCATQNCIDADVVFKVDLGSNPLYLIWQADGSSQIYTIALQ